MNKILSFRLFVMITFVLIQIAIIYSSSDSRKNTMDNDALHGDTLNMKVLVPAYFDPSSSGYWNELAAQAAKMPYRIYAIANKANGPGSKYDTSYAIVINNMHSNSGKVIGYVWTNYGAISLDNVKTVIDAWYSFYPSIDGIFLDGQASQTGKETYYIDLYNYIKQKNTAALVVSNPGINTLESYLVYNGQRVSDVICIFENYEGFDTWIPGSWCKKYTSDNFCVLPYNTSSSQYINRVNRAASLNIGWIYCTNDNGANPWDILPTYFEDFCNYLNNVTAVKNDIKDNKMDFNLSQNYPNPFNPTTIISYQIPINNVVSLKIYNIQGQEVETLVNKEQIAGKYSVPFNSSIKGMVLSSGIYFYQLKVGDYIRTRKMILIK